MLALAMVSVGSMASAGCDVDEVVWLINKKKHTADDIRKKCKNKINDVKRCSLEKVIKMVQDGLDANEIYGMCKKK
jgi:prefoldin subunit 5